MKLIRLTRVVAGILLFAAVVLPAPALAQGMFYQEVAKDGRIFVFADGQRYETFQKTGGAELGVAITRPGAGPNGETVVFDSEDAINYYNFKHNLPGEVFAKPKPAAPSAYPNGKVNGLAFGDFYYFPDNHDAKFAHQQGFWLRRAYLGYDYNYSATMNMRVRLEMNSNGALAGGSITPFVKDAYFNWKFKGNHSARLGIQPSLTFDAEEGFWGLRHIEKTPADLYGIDSSRDFALAFSGPLGGGGLGYAFQFGNDSGQNSETDKFKVVRLLALFNGKSGLHAEAAYNYGKRTAGQDRKTAKALVGFKGKQFRVAGEYLWQERRSGTASPNTKIKIWSGFGVFDVAHDKTSLFARYDNVKGEVAGADAGLPGADGIAFLPLSTAAPFNTVIFGLEQRVLGAIRVSPNVEWVSYDTPATGPKPGKDFVARFTFFWTW